MLADPNATFTKAVGLSVDLPSLGGLRSKSYSMLINNGVVAGLNVDNFGGTSRTVKGTGIQPGNMTCDFCNNIMPMLTAAYDRHLKRKHAGKTNGQDKNLSFFLLNPVFFVSHRL